MFSTANYSETERRHQQVKPVITTEHKDSPCKSLNEASVVLCLTARTLNPGRIEAQECKIANKPRMFSPATDTHERMKYA